MYKQVIVVRSDLRLGKGKLAAQCSHASLAAFRLVEKRNPEIATAWEVEGQKKIVLKVSSERELLQYFELARREGIPCELVRDAGHTQVEPGTITCFGAGPWNEEKLDKIFGKLKLL
ncbi:MAG: peptidyl-tRNA hydrolase Pth2 [Candidatus Bilamarchaeaceae archaeon]